MQYMISALLCLIGMTMSGTASANETTWWQADWKYRKPIVVDVTSSGVTGDVGRTPVLIRLHSGNFAFDGILPNGNDVRFIGSDGRTVLNHQIEHFDASGGIALIWVDVPGLRAGVPQNIWMYYGNEGALPGSNGQLVFDPDYVGVYHFADRDAVVRDTTAYGNHAANALVPVDGMVVGRGAQLTGNALVIPASPSMDISANGDFTFSAWIRPAQLAANQVIYSRRDGENRFLAGLDNGYPFVEVNENRVVAEREVSLSQNQHFAVVANKGQVMIYIDGQEVSRLESLLPAFAVETYIGADSVPAGGFNEQGEPLPVYNPFVGSIDEVRVSRVARSAALIQVDAVSQGMGSNVTAFGEDEQTEGVSHFGFIIKAMPVDAWIVVAVLFLMLLGSWAIMIVKSRYFGVVARANGFFSEEYRKAASGSVMTLKEMENRGKVSSVITEQSTLWNLYSLAVNEVAGRQAATGQKALSLSAIGSIRASLDAEVTRESERMGNRMSWLSTTIEGAPYVGLFGTVIGIMLVFAVAAIAGAVDINSVAPGMAAALLCTAAGLGVAIPALFGYNWLSSKAESIVADMSVFVDEFTARLAEEFEESDKPSSRA